tara:strand:+ start:654 stop:869 length:216 start_codon:yes stop_codon:yes gene_type:complete
MDNNLKELIRSNIESNFVLGLTILLNSDKSKKNKIQILENASVFYGIKYLRTQSLDNQIRLDLLTNLIKEI